MAQDDDIRDDSTQQEFNDADRVDETLRNQDVDPADVHDQDKQDMQEDTDEMDSTI